MSDFVLSIDEGTTRATVAVMNATGAIVAQRSRELTQHYPRPGWVEQDPLEIYDTVVALAGAALAAAGLSAREVRAIGITNQRETTVVWDRATGEPVYRAIVWQDRRGAELCRSLESSGAGRLVSERTGLVLDPYFSATKLAWLLDNDPELRRRAGRGELCFGTIDTWLISRLTGGATHVTEATNASRTLLMGLRSLSFETELLELFGIDSSLVPTIAPSGSVFGEVAPTISGLGGIVIAAVLGDQQAALFAHGCRRPGEAKNTYGTGSFVLANTGGTPPATDGSLLSTVALGGSHSVQYALEGSIFATGSAVQWLRDGLGLITDARETEALAASLTDNADVWFVPALAGLGAPYWDPAARGTLLGATHSTTRAHVVRAVLESIAWRTRDVLEAMGRAGHPVRELRADGGAATNAWLMQFQADVTGVAVEVAATPEVTALGAGYLAGLTTGLWKDYAEIERLRAPGRRFEPRWSTDRREAQYARWLEAVARSRGWARPSSNGDGQGQ